jgi:hypothetical protein
MIIRPALAFLLTYSSTVILDTWRHPPLLCIVYALKEIRDIDRVNWNLL